MTTVEVMVQCPVCTYEHQVTLPALALDGLEEDDDGVYRGLPDDPAFYCHECDREWYAYEAKTAEQVGEASRETVL
jgi:hypothetical protein